MQFPFYIGRLCGQKVIVSKTFQGMVNAGAATVLAISHFMPRCIINQGVCGGHDPALHRGDMILGETIFNNSNLRFSDSPDENPLHGCIQIGCESLRVEDAGKNIPSITAIKCCSQPHKNFQPHIRFLRCPVFPKNRNDRKL